MRASVVLILILLFLFLGVQAIDFYNDTYLTIDNKAKSSLNEMKEKLPKTHNLEIHEYVD